MTQLTPNRRQAKNIGQIIDRDLGDRRATYDYVVEHTG